MSKSVSVIYELHPPPNTNAPNLTATKTEEFPVKGSNVDGQKKYYEELREAIGSAKSRLGEQLTAWRDAVGNGELGKETTKTLKADDGEEEEEEDETT
jgi:hypothetical protein